MQYGVRVRKKKGESKIPNEIHTKSIWELLVSLVFLPSGTQDLHQEGKWGKPKIRILEPLFFTELMHLVIKLKLHRF